MYDKVICGSDQSHSLEHFTRHVSIARHLPIQSFELHDQDVCQIFQMAQLHLEHTLSFLALNWEVAGLLKADLV